MKTVTIDTHRSDIVVRDSEGTRLQRFSTYCNPAALQQAILWAESHGEIDWKNSQVAKPDGLAADSAG